MLPPTADSFYKVICQFFSWLCKVGVRGKGGGREGGREGGGEGGKREGL